MKDGSFGEDPPACPESLSSQYFPYPSVVTTFFIMMILSFILGVICFKKFNSVKLHNQSYTSSKISNTAWVLYFLGISLSDFFVSIQYCFGIDLNNSGNAIFLALNFIIGGFVTFFLTYALHHQYKYRCRVRIEELSLTTTLPTTNSINEKEFTTEVKFVDVIREIKSGWDFFQLLYAVLLALYMLMTLVLFITKYNDIAEIIFLIFYFIQQFPPLILIGLIIFSRSGKDESGPGLKSKIILGIGAILGLTSELPLNIWAKILPDSCTFYIASLVDLIHIIYSTSVFFFFLFIYREYKRSKNEVRTTTVTKIERLEF